LGVIYQDTTIDFEVRFAQAASLLQGEGWGTLLNCLLTATEGSNKLNVRIAAAREGDDFRPGREHKGVDLSVDRG
jgi:hypothetical protein